MGRRLWAHAAAVAGIGFAAVLWRSPAGRFYPRCPVFALLGVRCPGCGATRALAALLHGHLDQALRWNALFVVALPFLLGYAGVAYARAVGRAEFGWPQLGPAATYGCLAGVLAFAVAREMLGF